MSSEKVQENGTADKLGDALMDLAYLCGALRQLAVSLGESDEECAARVLAHYASEVFNEFAGLQSELEAEQR